MVHIWAGRCPSSSPMLICSSQWKKGGVCRISSCRLALSAACRSSEDPDACHHTEGTHHHVQHDTQISRAKQGTQTNMSVVQYSPASGAAGA